jgi:hypothetical protein
LFAGDRHLEPRRVARPQRVAAEVAGKVRHRLETEIVSGIGSRPIFLTIKSTRSMPPTICTISRASGGLDCLENNTGTAQRRHCL